MKTVLLIGTLDTKGHEIAYLRDRVRALGLDTLVLDSGILGDPIGCAADITRAEVARAGGYEIDALRTIGTRGAAVERMLHGVERVTLELLAANRIQGLISLGGAEGAVLGAAAAKVLPIGFPKIIVSPVASGQRRFGMFMGTRDVMVMHSVIDILGLNPISVTIFDNAAAAIWGMLEHGHRLHHRLQQHVKRYVAVTMLGNTTKGVMVAKDLLANNELADPLLGGFHAAPGRLERAGELGLPQVVVPGCVDFACFGPRHTVPEALRERPAYYHNPEFTLIRLNRDEMATVGATMARKLNAARGPVSVLIPLGGISIPNVPGGAFYDPEADAAFRDTLCADLRPDIPVRLVEAHINDPAFATMVAETFLDLMTR